MIFKLNPIRVVNSDNDIVRIVELKRTFSKEIDKIKITTLEGIPIKELEIFNNSIVTLDENLGEIKISYYIKEKFIADENVELIDKVVAINKLSDEEKLYIQLKEDVKNIMDTPKGTPAEISNHTELLKNTVNDNNARKYVCSKIRKELSNNKKVPCNKIEEYTKKIYADLYGLGAIQDLDDDKTIGEIIVNAKTYPKFECNIYYIKDLIKYRYNKTFKNLAEVNNVFRKIIAFDKKELNSTDNAMIEATRSNKDRVNIAIPDACEQWTLNIRKFNNFIPNKESMEQSGTTNDFIEKLFKIFVKGKLNIGIGGAMGTGKTTLIKYLLTYSDPITRKVIISSVSEFDVDKILKGHDVVILNVNEAKNFTFSKHMKFALRTTADRIIIPESRGEEFKEIYEANLKVSGNMFTGHALDDESFLNMCTEMYKSAPEAQHESTENVKNKIADSIGVIVIMRTIGNMIRIKSISEVVTENGIYKGMNRLVKWVINPDNPIEGHYERTANRITQKLKNKLNENLIPMSELRDI